MVGVLVEGPLQGVVEFGFEESCALGVVQDLDGTR